MVLGLPHPKRGRTVALNKQLVSLFAPLGADPACVDVSRILRVVGTLNSKNNQPVELLHQTDRDGHAMTYVFDDFADEVLPYSLEQIREWREAQKERYEAKGQVIHLAREKARERLKAGNRKAFNRFDWSWRVVEDIRTIADKKYGGVIPYCEESGHVAGPDMYAHIGASMLGNIIPSQQLWLEIKTWAGLILPASYVNDKRNLLAHSSTLLKKAKQVANMTEEEHIRNEEAGLNRKGAYRYKTQTIIDRLGITSDDMRNFNLKVLIDKDEKRRRDRENTRHKRREAGVMERVEWLNASNNKIAQALSIWPNEKKLTQQALADATDLSVRTIRSHLANSSFHKPHTTQP